MWHQNLVSNRYAALPQSVQELFRKQPFGGSSPPSSAKMYGYGRVAKALVCKTSIRGFDSHYPFQNVVEYAGVM